MLSSRFQAPREFGVRRPNGNRVRPMREAFGVVGPGCGNLTENQFMSKSARYRIRGRRF